MKCPNCGNLRKCRYINKKPKKKPRTDFIAKCRNCGWEGDISKYYDVIPQVKEVIVEKWNPRL